MKTVIRVATPDFVNKSTEWKKDFAPSEREEAIKTFKKWAKDAQGEYLVEIYQVSLDEGGDEYEVEMIEKI